ncbi:hypothetical protein ACFV1W_23945 [Kitasatospora sp. NPDC059648]|uniref:hypothetical protein n=1 Tax=Kitasatospora sp. NPDC059648 TaxID=3346894 RepID=UPI0036BA50D9
MRTADCTTASRTGTGRVAVTLALAIAALTLSACGVNTLQERSKPTITLDEAKKQIDGYLTDTLTHLPIQPAERPAFSDLECDLNDIGPHGRKETSRSYIFANLPLSDRTQAADAFRTYLIGRGFQPVSEPSVHIGWVKLKNPKDDFVAILDGASDTSRTFRLDISSPCVWPDGTPPA